MTPVTSPVASNGQLTGSTLDALNGDRGGAAALSSAKEQSDRFLKLLTTQLQNQDPLNPMDNAQMTSQMAQISTVTGVETLNTAMQAMTSQLVQLQSLQGAAMVGRNVLMEGDRMAISDGTGRGSFDMSAAASNVKVEVLNGAGSVVDTVPLGAVTEGRQSFEWDAGNTTDAAGYRFRVVARSGEADVAVTPLMLDQVKAVQTGGSALTLQLARGGSVPWSDIKSLN